MDRESLRKIQGIRLKKTVERVYHDTPFYRRKMQELGIAPDDINSIDDIVKLPFTTKYDLRDNYPFGLCAVPMSQICLLYTSLFPFGTRSHHRKNHLFVRFKEIKKITV